MTDALDLVVGNLHLLMALGALTFLWFVGWRGYHLDLFRQRLFAIRQELFDLAARGEVEFNGYAYGGLRQQINALIRFAHRLSFLRAAIIVTFSPPKPQGAAHSFESWQQSVAALDPAVRDRLRAIHLEVVFQMARYIVMTSPLLLIPLGIAWCVINLVVGAHRLRGFIARQATCLHALELLEEEAEVIEMEAA
jgi:hypothetical protein